MKNQFKKQKTVHFEDALDKKFKEITTTPEVPFTQEEEWQIQQQLDQEEADEIKLEDPSDIDDDIYAWTNLIQYFNYHLIQIVFKRYT